MSITTLIWLFPVAFMLHDFEELILFEPWLKRNAEEVRARLAPRVPAFLMARIDSALAKTTREFAVPVCMIFTLTAVSAFIAAEYGRFGFFLVATAIFFLHGFMHLAQAAALRRYVPALVTSALIVLPYGFVLYARLFSTNIVTWPQLLLYGLVGLLAIVPFILVMHWLGEKLDFLPHMGRE